MSPERFVKGASERTPISPPLFPWCLSPSFVRSPTAMLYIQIGDQSAKFNSPAHQTRLWAFDLFIFFAPISSHL